MTNQKNFLSIIALFLNSVFVVAQPGYTANDYVPPYNESFNIGSNLGYYGPDWKDEMVADVLAGNPEKGVNGVGCNSLRLYLSDEFIERYKEKYVIRQGAFAYYGELGCKNNTVFVGWPSDEHKDTTEYCEGFQSKMFLNMYLPIWDNGENGTPINDDNYFAAYIYWVATKYDNIRYWEIWNEPDFTYAAGANRGPGGKDNWWDNDPTPCTLRNLYAPVQAYIRALRIAYDVIKFVDEKDYVCLGGIGYQSFLDAILRNTDNLDGGQVTDEFPLKGGAYFDCLSYHIYPHFYLRYWTASGFVPTRHSDSAVEKLVTRKYEYDEVLKKYGYDGNTYPRKKYIITESNLASKEFDEYIGSHEAQRNYLMKALVKSQAIGIDAFHVYVTSDSKNEQEAENSYHQMGLYESMRDVTPYNQKPKMSGIGYRNFSYFLKDKYFDQKRTGELDIPDNIDGAAFIDNEGEYTYVLWAKTTEDKSETIELKYNFPSDWNISEIIQYSWDFTENSDSIVHSTRQVSLYGYPTFFRTNESNNSENSKIVTVSEVITPNSDGINDFWQIKEFWRVNNATICIYDYNGFKVFESNGYNNDWNAKANGQDLPDGAYYYTISFHETEQVQTGSIRVIR